MMGDPVPAELAAAAAALGRAETRYHEAMASGNPDAVEFQQVAAEVRTARELLERTDRAIVGILSEHALRRTT